ncbi:CheR family methyltransferase [Shewanella maritima]|uniref:CheR family methyltransferase n=1 Tax=Shewanella maritima TaxID=2520507 RepID=UPI003735A26E
MSSDLSDIYGLEKEFPMLSADFEMIQNMAHQHSGIVLPDRKRQMVYSRLSRRIRQLGIASFSEYLALVNQSDEEFASFINALTTNLTSFFREKHHFDFLKNTITPMWLARKQRRLRVWSAACSTGEEAYSIAMTLAKPFASPEWDFKILATDLDTNVLNTAKQGQYSRDAMANIPPDLADSYIKSHTSKQHIFISERIKRLIHFKQLNLLEHWPMKGPFDVIFCRNVFIYFDHETKVNIIKRFRRLLADDGVLIIGHSENLMQVSDEFTFSGQTIYRPKLRQNKP